MNLLTEFL